jgi:hypothetical protein
MILQNVETMRKRVNLNTDVVATRNNCDYPVSPATSFTHARSLQRRSIFFPSSILWSWLLLYSMLLRSDNLLWSVLV